MSAHLGCFDVARGSLLLEFGRGRNAVRVRRRGAVQPVIVGCSSSSFSFPPDALFLGFDSSTQFSFPFLSFLGYISFVMVWALVWDWCLKGRVFYLLKIWRHFHSVYA